MKYLLFVFLILMGCAQSNTEEEKPFSFIGTWEYSNKIYLFEQSPKKIRTTGEGCNEKFQCEFTPTLFILKLFQDQACSQHAEVVLRYNLTQENDSLYQLNSDQIVRSNYIPKGQHNKSDFPFFDNGVRLIRRSLNVFITYLSPTENQIIAGREYQSVYIEYRRVP